MKVMIAGGGNLGSKLSELLIKEKHNVVLVEKDEKRAEELGENLDALILNGDASDRKILKDGNIQKSDAFIAMTGDDKTNLLVCEIAKSFKVPKILSRINDASNEPIFAKLGITATINTTTSAIQSFKRALEGGNKRLACLVGGEKVEISEWYVNKKSKVANKKVSGFSKEDFTIAGIFREGDFVKPVPETRIQEGDSVLICVPVVKAKRVDKLFSS